MKTQRASVTKITGLLVFESGKQKIAKCEE